MKKWIVKNKICICTQVEKKVLSNFKALFLLNGNETIKFKVNVYNVLTDSQESIRNALNILEFFEKTGIPVLITGDEKNLKKFSLKALLYFGRSIAESIKILAESNEEKLALKKEAKEFKKLLPLYKLPDSMKGIFLANEMVKYLRKNCPWDKEQTHESLIPELIEEPLELAETIKRKDYKGIEEELGDVLLQVFFHALLGEEKNRFDINSVSFVLFEKMYERHPHVFKGINVGNSSEVLENWEKIKKNGKQSKTASISKILASLITSHDLQNEAKENGLDFQNVTQIEDKIIEELQELKKAKNEDKNVGEEIGDLLFSVVNLARFLGIDPAHALFISMEKFRKRYIKIKKIGKDLKKMPPKEIDILWERVKQDGNS